MQKIPGTHQDFNTEGQVIILGLMSGTSLDGLDLALVSFDRAIPSRFSLLKTETLPYEPSWQKRLKEAHTLTGEDLVELDRSYGLFLGECVKTFLGEDTPKPAAVCSHGHTVFHRPERGYTLQIGHGGALAAASGLPVISDFRSVDVALGGQGAPLVPIGDKLLWEEETIWVNLGGIANLTIPQKDGKVLAFDICPVNMALNPQAELLGKAFDTDGQWASEGICQPELQKQLKSFDFFNNSGAKSLGREWYENNWEPLIRASGLNPKDALATLCSTIADLISGTLNKEGAAIQQVKFTGGGALNTYLIEKIKQQCPEKKFVVADKRLIEFKEAIVFAFLGYLWLKGQNNVLSEVTGGRVNHIGGCLYRPFE